MAGEQEPHTNGLNGDASDDEEQKNMRPVDIEADVKEMERRKRVEAIMQSKLFKKSWSELSEILCETLEQTPSLASSVM